MAHTMHFQRGRKPPKLPIPLGIASPRRRRAEPWRWTTCMKNLTHRDVISLWKQHSYDLYNLTTIAEGKVIIYTMVYNMWQ